ncbi:hypothetical protein GPJ56_009500 [Histomonas meleagridis]|uniref:uncharacterized protein n=1 Tax=Histomonas meleagridis TaxID=135588 RepID=UPI003559A9D9|nr:hypothetical protein GPJ56_009500 [Histomonas meleagridis]KAH0804641.1 hypothetical protein GO595_002577 [Histomonas meleagridis]
MCEKFPTEQEISDALCRSSGEIFNMVDVLRFLNKVELNKPNHIRFICYLIGLKKMSPQRKKWIPTLLEFGEFYEKASKRYFEDCWNNPNISSQIIQATESKLLWFQSFACVLNIDSYYIQDSLLRVRRIYSVYMKENSGYKFSVLHIPICYITYLLSLSFSIDSGLSNFFAESLGYHLFSSIISIIRFSEQADHLSLTDDHYNKLKQMIHNYSPNIEKEALRKGVDLINIAIEWETSFFTEVHCPENLLLIWDNIVFHVEEYHSFMRYLFVAHFRWMEDVGTDVGNQKSIYETKWNALEILEDVEDLTQAELVRGTFNYGNFCPCYACCPKLFKNWRK